VSPPADRRKKDPRRLTISQVLDLVQSLADEHYQGDVQTNILSIFNELNSDNKRTFLRKSMMLHWEQQIQLANNDMGDVVLDTETRIDRVSVDSERKQISDLNYSEQIKLKSWMIKVFFLLGLVFFGFFILASYYIGQVDMKTILSHLTAVIEMIFGK